VTRSLLLYRTALLAALLFVDIASVLHAQTRYFVTDLSPLNVADGGTNAINDRGQVVGNAFRTAPNFPSNPSIADLGTLGGGGSDAVGINIWGQAVGDSLTDPLIGPYHAFRTAPNRPINPATDNLGTLGGPGSFANAINNLGQVVGYSSTNAEGLPQLAFRTAPNRPINPATDNLGTLGGPNLGALFGPESYANAINNWGQVVGSSTINAEGTPSLAFRTAPNRPINPATDNLGTLGGTSSGANSINDWGQVTGGASTSGDLAVHAFRTAPNRPINPATDDLGTLGGMRSSGTAINNLGQVVGYSFTTSDDTIEHAFLFSGYLMYDLNNLIPTDSGWELQIAYSINDAGQIVGIGIHNDDTYASFLLTPASRALCNSGWKNYGFENQEQCLQFAKTGK